MYVKENTCYHDRNREDADFNIYEVVKSHFRKKKDETEQDFEHRIDDSTNINVWMFVGMYDEVGDGWEHIWGDLR